MDTNAAPKTTASNQLRSASNNEELLDRIGQLTRTLHESMRELGLDREVEKAAEDIPDARDRLAYIASTTKDAADRALSAIEIAKPIGSDLAEQSRVLDARWSEWFDAPVGLDQARSLVEDTRHFLCSVPKQTGAIDSELNNIMMAQDFQDLTGQVVGKLVEVVRRIEQQLIQALIDNVPEAFSEQAVRRARRDREKNGPESLKNGPQINPERHADVVSDQTQVDDLLDSLGF